jgi:cell cycle sensor histidine kinase DivJ
LQGCGNGGEERAASRRETVLRTVEWASAVEARLAGLVHPSVEDPAERGRHARFILVRIMTGGLALASLPACLAWQGVPGAAACAAVLALVAQLGAAVVLMRTGLFTLAHGLASTALAAMIAGTALWGGSPMTVAWLLVVPAEALLSGSLRSAAVAAALAMMAVGVAAGLNAFAIAPVQSGPAALTVVLAVLLGAHAVAQGLEGACLDRAAKPVKGRDRSDAAVLQAIDDLVTWHDRNGHVVDASAASMRLLSLPAAALHGRGMFARVHVADRPAFLKAISDAATGTQPVAVQFRIHGAVVAEAEAATPAVQGATAIWVEMRAHRVIAAGDEGHAVVAVTRDVSEQRRRADELEVARAAAEKADALKGRFLATVSHELRTPLNAIIGFSEILGMDAGATLDAGRAKEYAQIIRSSGQHLLEVVNMLLDLSKIETGNFDFVPEPFDLAPLVHGCCDLVGLRAEQAGVALSRDIASDLPEFVSDRRACRQILINLLSNAVKFTPAGGRITVSVRREHDRLMLVVADTGIGIPEEDLPRLGDPFFQSGAAYDRAHEGSGLGLSVVRGLVGLHRGTMMIESSPGRGTVVSVKLPIDCRSGAIQLTQTDRVRPLVRPLERAPVLKSA